MNPPRCFTPRSKVQAADCAAVSRRSIRRFLLMIPFAAWLLAVADPAASQQPGAGPPPVVGVVEVTAKDVNPPTEYVGHVEPIQVVALRARVQGFLEAVRFEEGATIQAGDVLYVIEQAPYEARLDAAEAQVAQAEAALERARQYLKRLRSAQPESVPATDMDNAVAAEREAWARLQAAKAERELARINLDYTVIAAPIGGRIGRTAYTAGNLVDVSSGPLARIVQMDPIRVVYSISENEVSALRATFRDASKDPGDASLTVSLRLTDGSPYPLPGRVDFVDNRVDPATGTIAVWAVFENPERMLIPGQYVTVLVKATEPRVMPVVPQSAVLVNQEGHYVLVVDEEDRAVARPISLGPALQTEWAVASGLSGGERVIVQGIQKVRPGQQVQPQAAAGPGR